MSDTYQAVYDAARSRMQNGDIGSAVESAIRDANVSFYFEQACHGIAESFYGYSVPSAIYKPELTKDGNAWLAIYGDLPTGVVGCGDTPEQAMADFDKRWTKN